MSAVGEEFDVPKVRVERAGSLSVVPSVRTSLKEIFGEVSTGAVKEVRWTRDSPCGRGRIRTCFESRPEIRLQVSL